MRSECPSLRRKKKAAYQVRRRCAGCNSGKKPVLSKDRATGGERIGGAKKDLAKLTKDRNG